MEVHPEFGNIDNLKNILLNEGFSVWYMDKNAEIVDELTTIGYLFSKNSNTLVNNTL